jgi:hypothetical protein
MKRLAIVAALSFTSLVSQAAVTSVQWGANRTTAPWTMCVYDSNNICQGVFTLPSAGGGALVPAANGGTGVNNSAFTITLDGNVSIGGVFSTTGAFTTGGAFSTGSTFGTIGAFSTAGPFAMSGAFSFTGNLTGATNVTFPTSGTLLTSGTLGVTIGSTAISGGTNGDIEYNNSGVFGEKTVTGSGNAVLAVSPILITPNLGTPSAATLTNAAGLPISTGVSGLGAGVAAGLANAATGSGSPVLAVSPALTGSPTAPTQTSSDNTTKIATTAGVRGQISAFAVTSVTPGQGLSNSQTSTVATPITTTGTLYPDASYSPNFIGGLITSNDGAAPNTVLDVTAGGANDSTNVTRIKIGAFTKSTAGAWASGSGSNGMGNGLTIANSTWYADCLAFNGGTPDVWFDTSPVCANKPAGISGALFRRIGFFKTDSSANILAFVQNANEFILGSTVIDINSISPTQTPALQTLGSVPSGAKVNALIRATGTQTSGQVAFLINSPDEGSVNGSTLSSTGNYNLLTVAASEFGTAQLNVRTNATEQIRIVASAPSGNTLSVVTYGWVDTRGQ